MRKITLCICENKDTDTDQRLCFRRKDSAIPLNFEPLAIFCSCTAWFVSDQVGNQNVGFLMTRLIYFLQTVDNLKVLLSVVFVFMNVFI